MTKKFFLIFTIISLFFLSFFLYKNICKRDTLTYFQMMQDPYYQNPPKTKVDINTINIVSPSLKEHIGEKYIAEDLARYFKTQGKRSNKSLFYLF